MHAVLAICLGACIGALARWQLGLWLNHAGAWLPWGTLAANLAGGYLVGLCVAVFEQHPGLDPAECYAGAYMRVGAVDPLYAAFAPLGLPRQGIPRLEPVADKPWGLREFALLDEDGNLVKFGQVL